MKFLLNPVRACLKMWGQPSWLVRRLPAATKIAGTLRFFSQAVRLSAIEMVILAWCGAMAARADFPATVLSQGPVGYWRLNETAQPPAPRPAEDIGSLGAAGNGRYLFGPKRGEPGALTGS